MKFLRVTLLLLAVTLTMQSCLDEGYDFCPQRTDQFNTSIAFRLPDKSNNCIFQKNVTSVHALMFDASGNYIETQTLDATKLAEYQGIRLQLDPGTYRMVCWANMQSSLQFYSLGDALCNVSYTDKNGGMCGNSDPVYYAPCGPRTRRLGTADNYYQFTVDSEGHTSSIDFRDAHRTLEVFVEGLQRDGGNAPSIKVEGLPEGLYVTGMGHMVDTQGNKLTVYSEQSSESKTVDGTRYDAAKFWSLWFEDYNDIVITVYDKDGNERYKVPLADVIELTDDDEFVIRIVITFKGGNVEVGVPGWTGDDIGIGFWD